MTELLTDPWFYAAAVPAVILVGLSKGGLGGAMGFVGVPLMALAMSPVQARRDPAADPGADGHGVAVELARRLRPLDPETMMPGAMIGIGIGWLTAAVVTEDDDPLHRRRRRDRLRRPLALPAVSRRRGVVEKQRPTAVAATFWGTVAGFTSFVAHVGGPPYQVYTLPLGLDPKVFTGTSVIFFAITNAVKLIPYFALGQFDTANLDRVGGADADRAAVDASPAPVRAADAAGGLLSAHLCDGRHLSR